MDSVWNCAVDLYIKNSLRYIRAIIYVYNELLYEESLGSCASEGFGFKVGSLLLSRIALQYHRRNRA